MDEVEQDYRDPGIPPGRGYLEDRPFGDRPLPAPERFREPWNAREVRIDVVYVFMKSFDLVWMEIRSIIISYKPNLAATKECFWCITSRFFGMILSVRYRLQVLSVVLVPYCSTAIYV